MSRLKNYPEYIYIFLLCCSIFCFFSCENYNHTGNLKQPEFSKLYPSEKTDDKIVVETEVVQNEDIINFIQNFWKHSLNGEKKKVLDSIREAPEEFWKPCDSIKNRDNINTPNFNEDFPKGEGIGISLTEKKSGYLQLKYFSQDIQKAKPELLGTKIIRANMKEAVVKFDWRKFESKTSGISQLMLLYKDNAKWKIFMITDSLILFNYNKSFGFNSDTGNCGDS